MSKLKLAVMYGGVSPEHEVSIITAVQLMKHVDQDKYEVIPIYIDKAGSWWTGDLLLEIGSYGQQDLSQPDNLTSFSTDLKNLTEQVDVAILCFHGEYGEAGNVQGLLELAGIPYQGPGVLSSAICFDKIVTRQILQAEGINQAKFVWFTKHEWQENKDQVLAKIKTLDLPVFIKPANGGSTIGIEKVKTTVELSSAIDRVSAYDERLLVEAEIKDCIEVNVSVLGLEGKTQASVPEQPIKADEFLSYADKYERGGKGSKGGAKGGMASLSRRIPAPISSSLTAKLQTLAQKLFHIFDVSGVIRIDFFVDPSSEETYVVELNTIPGSMSFYLWEASGLNYQKLIDRLVEIAQQKFSRRHELVKSFESNILKDKSAV